jgi:hypothetical protein
MTFPEWLRTQVHREDLVGYHARDFVNHVFIPDDRTKSGHEAAWAEYKLVVGETAAEEYFQGLSKRFGL